MVPLSSLRIPRVRKYSGYSRLSRPFTYKTLTLSGWLSHAIRLRFKMLYTVLTPNVLLHLVWPLPLSLATTRRISFDFSSSGYLDVSVPRVPHVNLCIQLTFHDSSSWWFPNSEICGSMYIYYSPQLIAVSHVLRRLPMPRHSPYALLRLNNLFAVLYNCLSFVQIFVVFWFAFCFTTLSGKIVVSHLTERPSNLI